MHRKTAAAFIEPHRHRWEDKTPCFLVTTQGLREAMASLKTELGGEIAYSYKTNPHPTIGRIILAEGASLLFSSVEELEAAAVLEGFSAAKAIFQSPSLTSQQLGHIWRIGVRRVIIDSHDQLAVVLENLPADAELLIRVNTGVRVNDPALPYGMDSFLGFPLCEAGEVFRQAQQLKREGRIARLGLHNHLLSQNTHLGVWRANAEVLADFVEKLKRQRIELDTVDFGGGYPVAYHEPVPSLREIAAAIGSARGRITACYPEIHFIFEPGRKVVAESISLLAKVVHLKNFVGQAVAILDCSLYNSSMDTLIVGLCPPTMKLDAEADAELLHYVIRGSSPDSLDVFWKSIMLPQLRKGDCLAFVHAGAYSFSSDFISLAKPSYVFVEPVGRAPTRAHPAHVRLMEVCNEGALHL